MYGDGLTEAWQVGTDGGKPCPGCPAVPEQWDSTFGGHFRAQALGIAGLHFVYGMQCHLASATRQIGQS